MNYEESDRGQTITAKKPNLICIINEFALNNRKASKVTLLYLFYRIISNDI